MSEPQPEAETWYAIGQAAHRLGVHTTTLRRWADRGDIAFTVTPGGHRRFAAADIEQFAAEQRRARRRPEHIEKKWAETALAVTRRTLAKRPDERWLGDNGGWREQHREIGRQLMGLTMQFISAEDDDAPVLFAEARRIGRRYAQIAHQRRLPLADALRASIFFRDMLVETALEMPDHVRVRPQTNVRLLRRINALLNTVHLTIAEEYHALNRDDLSRD